MDNVLNYHPHKATKMEVWLKHIMVTWYANLFCMNRLNVCCLIYIFWNVSRIICHFFLLESIWAFNVKIFLTSEYMKQTWAHKVFWISVEMILVARRSLIYFVEFWFGEFLLIQFGILCLCTGIFGSVSSLIYFVEFWFDWVLINGFLLCSAISTCHAIFIATMSLYFTHCFGSSKLYMDDEIYLSVFHWAFTTFYNHVIK